MGGKSLNRFSSFVTSGAEEWVLKGAPEDKAPPPAHHRLTSEPDEVVETTLSKLGIAEEDMHYVDEGPSWKIKVPPFRILVHSPAKRTSPLTGSYTVYSVTSLFRPPGSEEDLEAESHRVTVQRRFSHFVAFHTALSRRLPGIALPPLPEKQYAGRFSEAFIEARRGDLERYVGRIVRHPVARYAEVLTFFLACEDDLVCPRCLSNPHLYPNLNPGRNGNERCLNISTCHLPVPRSTRMFSTLPTISIPRSWQKPQTDSQITPERSEMVCKV